MWETYVKAGWKIFFGTQIWCLFQSQSKWLEIEVYENAQRWCGVLKGAELFSVVVELWTLTLHAVSFVLKPTWSDNKKRNNRPFLKMNVN